MPTIDAKLVELIVGEDYALWVDRLAPLGLTVDQALALYATVEGTNPFLLAAAILEAIPTMSSASQQRVGEIEIKNSGAEALSTRAAALRRRVYLSRLGKSRLTPWAVEDEVDCG